MKVLCAMSHRTDSVAYRGGIITTTAVNVKLESRQAAAAHFSTEFVDELWIGL
jgi:hypothetical protein